MALTTSVLHDGPVAVIVLEGELDLAVTSPLTQAVSAALADGFRRLVLDVSRLTFCDSCGLGAIMQAHRAVTSHGGHLAVAGAQGGFARLVDVTSVGEVLHLVPDVGQALTEAQPAREREHSQDPEA